MKILHFARMLLICGAAIWVAAPLCAQSNTASSTSLTLARDGKSEYSIVLASDAIDAEKTAAAQLQQNLQKVTGATLPIKEEAEVAADAPQILVGAGARVKTLLPRQDWNTLGHDGIVIKTVGKNLILAGGRPRGALYAVFEFLEKSAGVRWWTPTESTIPHRDILTVAPQNTVYISPFAYREHFANSVQSDPLFATRMRENGNYMHQGEELGGHYTILGFVHTFDLLLPPEKYFKEHPEWYSDPDNGGKPCTAASRPPLPQRSQLCLSNDAMRAELTKNALEWIRKDPSAGIISISQNDNNDPCTDDASMALERSEGSPAGPILNFVNKVATDIEKEFPNFLVETLAYGYTIKPPRTIKPRHNVVVRLCTDGDMSRPFDSAQNAKFREYLNDWKAIAPRLYIWDYITNFNRVMWPHPNLRVLAPNLRYYARSNVFGVFMQGDAYSNGTGDFTQLRTWLVAKLMWDPRLDDRKLTDEFMQGYYGAASTPLKAYLNLINDAFQRSGKPLSAIQSDSDYLTPDVINKAWGYFQSAAQAVATDAVLAQRVRRERLALDNVIITKYSDLARSNQAKKMAFFPSDIGAFIADFIQTARANKAINVSEYNSFDNYALILGQRFAARAPLPEPLRSQIPPGEIASRVIDAQDSQFQYYMQPQLSDRVDDALASDGKAGRVVGQTDAWALQYNILESADVLKAGSWHAYAVIRIEAKPGAVLDAPAFTYGIYDTVQRRNRLGGVRNLTDYADGQYHLVDLGVAQLDKDCYMFVAPPRRDDIIAIYVDRMILVHEADAKPR